MPKMNMTRKPQIQGNNITIESEVFEELSKEEYIRMYNNKSKDYNELTVTIEEGKRQLEEFAKIEETKELKKLKEQLILADKLKRKDGLIENLKMMEIKAELMEKELKELSPIITKLHLQGL